MSKIVIPEDSPQALKDLVARAERTEGEEEKQKIVSARDRLMRHLNNQTFKIQLSDEDDDFIEVRLLTPQEQLFITDLSNRLTLQQRKLSTLRTSDTKTAKARKKRDTQIQEVIAETEKLFDQQNFFLAAVTVDKDLDFEFWKDGSGYPSYLATYILGESLRRSYDTTRERVAQAKFFRNDGTR
jgi:hypothetical protein